MLKNRATTPSVLVITGLGAGDPVTKFLELLDKSRFNV